MADVRSGLTVEGHSLDSTAEPDFGTQLAEQASKGAPAAREEREPAEPWTDGGQEIYDGVLDQGDASDLRGGLTFKSPKLHEPFALGDGPLTPEQRASLDSFYAEKAAEEAEAEEGRQARRVLAAREFIDSLEDVETEQDVVGSLADLKARVDEGTYTELLYSVAASMTGLDQFASDVEDDELNAAFAEVMDSLDRSVDVTQGQRDAERAAETARELIPLAAEQRVKDLKAAIGEWRNELGLTPEQTRARLAAAEAVAPDWIGAELHTLAPDVFTAALRSIDAALADQNYVDDQRAFQRAVATATTASVRDGLEHLTPWGWRADNAINLDAGGPPLVDADRVSRRAVASRTTGDDIRREVGAPESNSVRAGLTGPDGKSISLDDASGARERFEQQRRDDLARARGLLR